MNKMQLWAKQIGYYRNLLMWLLLPLRILSMPQVRLFIRVFLSEKKVKLERYIQQKKRIFVVGGSQGAAIFSRLFPHHSNT